MKILQLNVWMGRLGWSLLKFMRENEYDVICMQEVVHSEDYPFHTGRLFTTLPQIQEVAKMGYVYFSANWGTGIAGDGTMKLGNAILSRVPFVDTKTVFVNKEYKGDMVLSGTPSNISNVQIVKLENGLTFANHHGYWDKSPLGNEDSTRVMRNVARELVKVEGPLVFCGDLNIVYEAEAMRALDFLKDLTHESRVKTTLPGLRFDGNVACDHILVSGTVKTENFSVRQELISDHFGVEVEIVDF